MMKKNDEKMEKKKMKKNYQILNIFEQKKKKLKIEKKILG